MRLRIELTKDDILVGMKVPKPDKVNLHIFRRDAMELFHRAEYVLYKSPSGKKKVLKSRTLKADTNFIGL